MPFFVTRSAPRLAAVMLAVLVLVWPPVAVRAEEAPQDDRTPVASIIFSDKPLRLPVGAGFTTAMQAAARDLGLEVGIIESYGWRMQQNEQARVNAIFTTTVNGLRGQGFEVAAQTPASVADDITVFTARRADRTLLIMLSAGDEGLLLLAAEAAPPAAPETARGLLPPVAPMHNRAFSPLGIWAGNFRCAAGVSGGTLEIFLHDETRLEGVFRYAATMPDNPVPGGAWRVIGNYDAPTRRVFLIPGLWIKRPDGASAAPIIGGFDAAKMSFTGLFQGRADCGNFEAYYVGKAAVTALPPAPQEEAVVKPKKIVKKHKKPAMKKSKSPPAATGSNQRKSDTEENGILIEAKKSVAPKPPANPEKNAAPMPPMADESHSSEDVKDAENIKAAPEAPRSTSGLPIISPAAPLPLLPVPVIEEKVEGSGLLTPIPVPDSPTPAGNNP